jgi:hypothetical protein
LGTGPFVQAALNPAPPSSSGSMTQNRSSLAHSNGSASAKSITSFGISPSSRILWSMRAPSITMCG